LIVVYTDTPSPFSYHMEAEQRPLLAGNDDGDDALIETPKQDDGFFPRLLAEPLTELARLLLFVSVGLLLLASVFIGLFAGAERRLYDLKHTQPSTTTQLFTATCSATLTTPCTSTTYTATTTSTIPPPTRVPDAPKPASAHSPVLCSRKLTLDPLSIYARLRSASSWQPPS
jgi:endothelin-converting enzyme